MKAELKPEELRIGNWVKWPNEKEPNEVQWELGHWLGIHEKNYGYPVGIELSEEWLLKAGFEKTTEVTWSFGYERQYLVYRKGLFTYNGIQASWWYNGQVLQKQPEYVHQLQNLFFVLEGNELIFNHG